MFFGRSIFHSLQVEDLLTCRLVGMFTHYFTLCNLVWLVLSVNSILERATAHRQRHSRAAAADTAAATDILRGGAKWEENAKQQQQEQQRGAFAAAPIARLYLVGWGSGAAVTAVCCAVDATGYGLALPSSSSSAADSSGAFITAADHHCFMRLTPFLAGVALPASVLTALMVGFALSAWCVATSPPAHITEQVNYPSFLRLRLYCY